MPNCANGRKKRDRSLQKRNPTVAEVLAQYKNNGESGVFADGGAAPNPGDQGGWGAVWVEKGEIVSQVHGHEPRTTSMRMELQALIEAFKMLPPDAEVEVYSDSQWCVKAVTELARKWEEASWKSNKGPIKDLELVQNLVALHRAHPGCKLKWTPAHAGNLWNEYADSLAAAWMRATL